METDKIDFNKDWYDQQYAKHVKNNTTYALAPEKTQYFNLWRKALKVMKAHYDNSWEFSLGDLGCGPGQFIELAVRHGITITWGYDFSEVAIGMAKRRLPKIKNVFRVKNIVKGYRSVKMDNRSYWPSVVTCFEFLEHIKEDLKVLRNLPSQQYFVFSVPNYNYKSHVRYFINEDEIIERYSGALHILQIVRVAGSVGTKCIWIVESIKK